MEEIKTNSWKAWKYAFRFYSLPGAATPVVIGMALAWADIRHNVECGMLNVEFSWKVAILAFLFAEIMQIDSNIINDYFDFVKGRDNKETRLGPKRACAEGWITPKAMRIGIGIVTCLGALVGLPLALYGGWEMIIIGALCIAGAFLYTTYLGPRGWGDVLCVVFFGIVPVCVPYYIQTGAVTMACWCVGLAAGIVIDGMLIANNYRDIPTDLKTGKRTLCTILGAENSRRLFFCIAPAAVLLNIPLMGDGHFWAFWLPLAIYQPMHNNAWGKMREIREGAALNKVLGLAARNIVIYGLTTAIGILI